MGWPFCECQGRHGSLQRCAALSITVSKRDYAFTILSVSQTGSSRYPERYRAPDNGMVPTNLLGGLRLLLQIKKQAGNR